MNDVFESIRWGSVLLSVVLMGFFGLVHKFFLVPMEKIRDIELNRSKMLRIHLHDADSLGRLASDLLISFAGDATSNAELLTSIQKIEVQATVVRVAPEVLQALEQFIRSAKTIVCADATQGNNIPTSEQMASLEHAYGRFCSTILQVTERLADMTN
jgi:hypothetical protein